LCFLRGLLYPSSGHVTDVADNIKVEEDGRDEREESSRDGIPAGQVPGTR
jgi:hypothetical protein